MSEPKIEPIMDAYGELVGATVTREMTLVEVDPADIVASFSFCGKVYHMTPDATYREPVR